MESLGGNASKKEESSLEYYVTKNTSLKWAPRIESKGLTPEVVEETVFKKGEPLVVSNVMASWRRDRQMFSWDWLKKNHGDTQVIPRNSDTQNTAEEMTVNSFVTYLSKPAPLRTTRLYAKDIPCPEPWEELIDSKMEAYMNKNQSDLIGYLNEDLQPETLSVVVSGEETVFPLQLQTLGTLVHNIMVNTDDKAVSWWLITSRNDREKLEALLRQRSNASFLVENQTLTLQQFSELPFPVYAIEQKEGDFVILPSECVYQVFNKFAKSIKVSWDVMNAFTVKNSYYSSLPLFRGVGKPEVYKVKAVAFYGVQEMITSADHGDFDDVPFPEAYHILLDIIEDFIYAESINVNHLNLTTEERAAFKLEAKQFNDEVQHGRTCDFCKCDLFYRGYHCSACPGDGYDICVACVAEGRGCAHKEKLQLHEYMSNQKLRDQFKETVDDFHKMLKNLKKKKTIPKKFKSLGEWKPKRILVDSEFDKDSSKLEEVSDASISYRLALMYKKENTEDTCHQCQKIQPYGLSPIMTCSKFVGDKRSAPKKCDKRYCSRCLWNRYGEKISACMKNPNWICPCCRSQCNCAVCTESKPADLTAEKLVNTLVDNFYPFAAISSPNIPAISDLKPTFQVHAVHALKKRKMMFATEEPVKTEPPKLEKTPVKEEPKKEENVKMETELNVWEVKAEPSAPVQTQASAPVAPSPSSQEKIQPWGSSWGGPVEGSEGPSSHKPYRDVVNTVLIRNLDYGVAESALYSLFGSNNVENVTIPKKNGKKKGIAFVKFKTKELAENAMKNHNLHKFNERAIEMCWAEDRTKQQQQMVSSVPPMIVKPANKSSVCFYCNQPGHLKFQCPSWNANQQPKNPSSMQEDSFDAAYNNSVSILQAPEPVDDWEKSRKSGGYKPDARTCFKCGKEGHMTLQCPEKGIDTQAPVPTSGTSTPGRVVCFKCGTPGHTAPQCDFRSKGCWVCGMEGHVAKDCAKKKTEQQNYLLDQPDDYGYGQQSSSYSDPYYDTQKSRKVTSEGSPTARAESGWDKYPSSYKESRSGWDDRGDRGYTDDRRDSYGAYRGSSATSYRESDRTSSRKYGSTGGYDYDAPSSSRDSYGSTGSSSSRDRDYYDYNKSRNGQDYYSSSASSTSRNYDNYNGSNSSSSYRNAPSGLSGSGSYSKGYSGSSSYSNGSSTPTQSSRQQPSYSPPSSSQMPQAPMVPNGPIPLTGIPQLDQLAYLFSLQQGQQLAATPEQQAALQSILAAPLGVVPMSNPTPAPQQTLPSSSSDTSTPKDSDSKYDDDSKKRQGYKSKCGDVVVRYLNKYFQPPAQLVASKEDFKLLAKKMTGILLEKGKSKNYNFDRDEEARAKKCVDKYVADYLKVKAGPADQLTQWFNSSS